MTSLHLALPGNVHLKENQQKLTDDDVKLISLLLKGNTFIRSLDLRYNRISDQGAQALSTAIKVHRNARMGHAKNTVSDWQISKGSL